MTVVKMHDLARWPASRIKPAAVAPLPPPDPNMVTCSICHRGSLLRQELADAIEAIRATTRLESPQFRIARLAELGIPALAFTPTEQRILAALLPPGGLRSRAEIERAVWPGGFVHSNTVRTNINRIRNRMRQCVPGWTIASVFAVGYRLKRCKDQSAGRADAQATNPSAGRGPDRSPGTTPPAEAF